MTKDDLPKHPKNYKARRHTSQTFTFRREEQDGEDADKIFSIVLIDHPAQMATVSSTDLEPVTVFIDEALNMLTMFLNREE